MNNTPDPKEQEEQTESERIKQIIYDPYYIDPYTPDPYQ